MNDAAGITDFTDRVEDLGIPFSVRGYARNVWDMQVYNNKLYLGHGNCNNYSSNAQEGQIPICYYDMTQQNFVREYMTDEDQLSNYKLLDGQLYLPGLDSRESWEYGNFYRLVDGHWEKYRNVPNGVHVFDMAMVNGILYVSTGSGDGNVLYKSDNCGKTWKPVTISAYPPFFPISNRMHTLIGYRNKVYATSAVFSAAGDTTRNKAVVIDGTTVSTINIYRDKILPGTQKPYQYYMLGRATTALEKMVYISHRYDYYNTWIPEALYFAADLNKAARVVLPETAAVPMDIAVRGSCVYVLAYLKVLDAKYTNFVFRTENTFEWTEVLRFNHDTFARSFEEVYGNFYFGMGCFTERIPASTGKILRLSAETLLIK